MRSSQRPCCMPPRGKCFFVGERSSNDTPLRASVTDSGSDRGSLGSKPKPALSGLFFAPPGPRRPSGVKSGRGRERAIRSAGADAESNPPDWQGPIDRGALEAFPLARASRTGLEPGVRSLHSPGLTSPGLALLPALTGQGVSRGWGQMREWRRAGASSSFELC